MIYLTSWLWYIQSCKALQVQSSVKIKPKSSVWLKRDLGSMHSECPCTKTASTVLQHSSCGHQGFSTLRLGCITIS